MIKRRWNFNGKSAESAATTSSSSSSMLKDEEVEWEMRPGGMLVQKRCENSDHVPVPNLRVRVAYGAMRYDVSVNSQSTFGELKKHLTAETGLQDGEQRLIFRGKERENGEYLDMCGVKDRSKVILIEDPASIERRVIQMRKNAEIQTAHRLISDISMEVDQLAQQAATPLGIEPRISGSVDQRLIHWAMESVSAIEKSIANGVKVPELQITTLIEMLMRQAVKLDNISAEGDTCEKKNSEGKRVQKCVETLDVLKVSNAKVKPVIVTTKWETFDPSPPATSKWEIFD